MRRLLLPALVVAILVGSFAGVASARLAGDSRDQPVAAPFRAPVTAPPADPVQPDSWTFRSSAAIGADMQAGAAPAATGGGSTVIVTAVVLPVVIIVLDAKSGDVSELVTNTEQRDARSVVYLVRVGDPSGAPAPLTAGTWSQARVGMAEAVAGTGSIWAA